MKYLLNKIFILVPVCILGVFIQIPIMSHSGQIYAQSTSQNIERFFTLSTVRARPQALGGAFTAVRDGISSALYNPANLELHPTAAQPRFTFFINPVGLSMGLLSRKKLKSDGTWDSEDIVASAGLGLKSIGLSWSAFEAVVILTETLPNLFLEPKQKAFFESEGILNEYSHTFASKLQLANQVSIGASVTLYKFIGAAKKEYSYESCYGILIKPDKNISIGLAYFDFPNIAAAIRTQFDRIVDETINLGVSWRPHHSTLLSLDIRNVSEEQKAVTRELHFGAELVPFKHLALRGGFFRKRLDRGNVFSAGLGLLNSNIFNKSSDQFASSDWIINYSLVYKDRAGFYEAWHFFSMLFQF